MGNSLLRDFQKFSFRRLPAGRALPCTIYLYFHRNQKMLKFVADGFEITEAFLSKYEDRGLSTIWVSNSDWDAFKTFIRESGDEEEIASTDQDAVEKELEAEEQARVAKEKTKSKDPTAKEDSDSEEGESEKADSAEGSTEEKKKKKSKDAGAESGEEDEAAAENADKTEATEEVADKDEDKTDAEKSAEEDAPAAKKKKKLREVGTDAESDEQQSESKEEAKTEENAGEEEAEEENEKDDADEEAPAAKRKKRFKVGTGADEESEENADDSDEESTEEGAAETQKKKKSKDAAAEGEEDETEEENAEDEQDEEEAEDVFGKKKKRFAIGSEAGEDEETEEGEEETTLDENGEPVAKKKKKRTVGTAIDEEAEEEAQTPEEQEMIEAARDAAAAAKRDAEEEKLSPEERKERKKKRAQQAISENFKSKEDEIDKPTQRDLNRTIERALQNVFAKNANSFQAILEVSEFLPDGSHGLHVCHYASMIAMALGMTDEKELAPLMSAALLHDLGHTQISIKKTLVTEADAAKNKPNAPQCATEAEEHITEAMTLIERLLGEEGKATAEIIASHHEKFDGTGFPKKLKAEAIPKMSQILAIADRIDQMVSGQWDTVKRSLNEVAATFDFQYVRAKKVTDFDPALMKEVVKFMSENADALNEVVDEMSGKTAENLMGQGHDSLKTRTKAA